MHARAALRTAGEKCSKPCETESSNELLPLNCADPAPVERFAPLVFQCTNIPSNTPAVEP